MRAFPYYRRSARSRWRAAAGLAGAGVFLLAACGKSSSSTTATTAGSTATTSTTATGTPAGITIATANVAGVGTVLVNGSGKTLYILTSEQGGKITCTDDSGCTKVWPDNELPKGVTAATPGSGVDASKLGTAKNAAGDNYVTYGGYPLYTFSHDSGPGTANGEGVMSFGGTWYTMAASGAPVTTPTAGATTTTASASTNTTVYKY